MDTCILVWGICFHPWYTHISGVGSTSIYGASAFCWKHTDAFFTQCSIPIPPFAISVSTQMKGEKAQVRQLCFLIVESRQAFEHRPFIPISKLSALSTRGDGLLTRDKSPMARMGPTYRCYLSAKSRTHILLNHLILFF